MKQGTVSVLFGCHSVVHSVLVWRSWKILYGKCPGFKETVCILLHDIGHWGTEYLDNFEEKRDHWRLGARVAGKLFGWKYYVFCAGHCDYSNYPPSPMFKADKYAAYLAPYWWLYLANFFEPKIRCGMKSRDAVSRYKAQAKHNVESGEYKSNHEFYLERRRQNNQ
jgi:hypothetical protein